jgi:beta-glucanase (GH16 family)
MGGVVTGAQIRSAEFMTSGHLSMTTRISPVHGTCQALFTYIDEANFPKAGDEQDIEIRGQLLDKGIQLTQYNPEYVFTFAAYRLCETLPSPSLSPICASRSFHIQSESTWHPFPSEPTTSYHNYTIFWPPADASPRRTSYYFDGKLLKTFDKYVSVNPSRACLSNWSNGQLSFTQGPPVTDAVLEVRRIAWYYSTAKVPGLPSGCTMEQACRV